MANSVLRISIAQSIESFWTYTVVSSSKSTKDRTLLNSLTGHTVGRCDLPDRAGNFPPDINVYAISNFLTSSLVLDIFFGMKLFAIKFSLGIFVLYLKYFNSIANNMWERKNSYEKCFFLCKTNKCIPYADNVKNVLYYVNILCTGKSLVKKMQGTR